MTSFFPYCYKYDFFIYLLGDIKKVLLNKPNIFIPKFFNRKTMQFSSDIMPCMVFCFLFKIKKTWDKTVIILAL